MQIKRTVFLCSIVAIVIIVGTTVVVNRREASDVEYSEAAALVSAVEARFSGLTGKPQIYFEARSGLVTLNIYDVLNDREQDKLVGAISEACKHQSCIASVGINFFPARELETSTNPDGSTLTIVRKGPAVRTLRINSL